MSKINVTDPNKMGRYSDSYSRNQCSLMIRVDDGEVEVPLNFGMTNDEIKRLYPFILQFAEMPIKNPAVQFGEDEKHGKYSDLSDTELEELLVKIKEQSRFWFEKSEASLLDIAIRFALDIKLRGIEELADIFAPASPLETLKAEPITDDEAEQIINDMGLETETDREFDAGDEYDIPLGIAGGLDVNLYSSTEDDDYLSQELDAMEAKLDVEDKFSEIIDNDTDDVADDRYASNYVPGQVSEGMLSMYDDETSTVFDELDAAEGNVIDNDIPSEPSEDIVESDVTSETENTDVSFEDDNGDEDDYDWDEDFDENGDDEEN